MFPAHLIILIFAIIVLILTVGAVYTTATDGGRSTGSKILWCLLVAIPLMGLPLWFAARRSRSHRHGRSG